MPQSQNPKKFFLDIEKLSKYEIFEEIILDYLDNSNLYLKYVPFHIESKNENNYITFIIPNDKHTSPKEYFLNILLPSYLDFLDTHDKYIFDKINEVTGDLFEDLKEDFFIEENEF